MNMNKSARIYIAGHRGMVGSAIYRGLQEEGYHNFVLKTSAELDLRNQKAVNDFFRLEKPQYVFLAAAKVGGILANATKRAEFLYDNLMIQSNIIHASYIHQVSKLLFLGSSCIYPKFAEQPMKEETLLSGYLEPSNEPYAIAKIAGIKLIENYRYQYGCNYISAMPTNLYGPNDNYDLESSHVIPALIRKFHEAKKSATSYVKIWGTGAPLREFMYVEDLSDVCVFLMKNYDGDSFINIGSGEEVSILELAKKIKTIVGYTGQIKIDPNKLEGTPRKLMDSSKIKALGWKPKTSLVEGLKKTYSSFAMKC